MWMPTKHDYRDRATTALFAVAFITVGALIVRDDLIVSVAAFVLMLYVAARIWSGVTVRRVEVMRRCPERAIVGESLTIEVRVRNCGRMPIPWLELSESVPPQLERTGACGAVIALKPRGEHIFRYKVRPRQRGVYRVGPLTAGMGDLLGIENHTLVIRETQSILVYPRIVPLARLGLPAGSAAVTVPAARSLLEDAGRMLGVREYRPGDSLRHVHWPVSAHTGRPHVRQFQPAIGRPTLLCLDLDPYAGAIEETVAVAASLANHIIRKERQPVGMITQGVDHSRSEDAIAIPPGHTDPHLMFLLECLARVQPRRRDTLPQLLRETSGRLPPGASVVLVSGTVHTPLLQALLEIRGRGLRCSVVVVGPHSGSRTAAPAPGIPVYRVRDEVGLGTVPWDGGH